MRPEVDNDLPMMIRDRRPEDEQAVLGLVRDAFGGDGRTGQDEVDIVLRTWSLGSAARPVDLVAVDDRTGVIGHVLGAAGTADDHELLAVAPLAVSPSHQGRGVGTALMTELLRRAETARWPAVVLLGAPAYYGRFGFEPAGHAGIVYPPVGPDSPHFQIRWLGAHRPAIRGDFSYCWERPPGQ